MQLLRMAVLSGATEQASSGAAATGAGMTIKLGIGTLVTTGALFAGTHAVKDHSPPASSHPGEHATAAASSSDRAGASATRSVRSKGHAVTTHRPEVIVTPKAVSTHHSSAPSHPATRPPEGDRSGTGIHSDSPPPPTGSGGSGGPTSPDTSSTQTYSAPSTKDCQNPPARDPAPGPVSPG
jgi:hypothetical protein